MKLTPRDKFEMWVLFFSWEMNIRKIAQIFSEKKWTSEQNTYNIIRRIKKRDEEITRMKETSLKSLKILKDS